LKLEVPSENMKDRVASILIEFDEEDDIEGWKNA
jgi:hypothetical protein